MIVVAFCGKGSVWEDVHALMLVPTNPRAPKSMHESLTARAMRKQQESIDKTYECYASIDGL